jgi:two-component sensor histidine kinase
VYSTLGFVKPGDFLVMMLANVILTRSYRLGFNRKFFISCLCLLNWAGADLYAQTERDSAALCNRISEMSDNMWIDYPVELEKAKSIHEKALDLPFATCKARSFKLLGKFYWANGEYKKGLAHFRNAISLATQAHDTGTVASSLSFIANTYYYQAYYDSAQKYFEMAGRIYGDQHNIQGMITVFHNASLMYHRKGDFKEAIRYLFKTEELKDQLPQNVHEVETMGSMGGFSIDSTYYREEIQDELKDLKVYIRNNDLKSVYRVYHNIGKAYRQLKEHRLAARYFVKASQISVAMGSTPIWETAGMDYAEVNEEDSCFYYHYLAKLQFRRATQLWFSTSIEHLGDAHMKFGHYDSALFYYDSAFRMHYRMNNRISYTGIHRQLVKVYSALGNFSKAEYHLQTGLILAKDVALSHQVNLFREGKILYEKMGDYKKTAWYAEKSLVYQDSLNRAEAVLNLTRLQVEFNTAKKTREVEELRQKSLLHDAEIKTKNLQIALAGSLILVVASTGGIYYTRYRQKKKASEELARQNVIIESQNVALQKQIKTNEILLSEIHHRVKNNLQVISSIIQLKSRQALPETGETLQKLSGRIFSMGLIHEKLYQNQNIQRVRLDEYVKELAQYLLQSFEDSALPVKLQLDMDKIEVGVDQALSCGLICNELITNAIKYAFSEGQLERFIQLKLRRAKSEIELTVLDNGKGSKMLSSSQNGMGFGLRFVEQLAITKLFGSMGVNKENGYDVKIKFPASQNG